MKNQIINKLLVDRAVDGYVEWREACFAVSDAYARWAIGPATDSALAFAAYGAALDREESASEAYADLIGRAGPQVATSQGPSAEFASLARGPNQR